MLCLTLAVAVAVAAGGLQAGPTLASDVRDLNVSTPVTTRTLSGNEFKGTPTRMCPSPDLSQLFLRFSERDRWGNETARLLLVTLKDHHVLPAEGEPAWAQACWARKSGPESPALPGLRIKVETREDLVRTINVPNEGDVGQHSGDPNATLADIAGKAAMASQKTFFEELRLHGQVVGKAVNRHVVPGTTFGWAPAPHALIAYANEKGNLVLMDAVGRTRQVPKTKKASLPVWSEDGRSLLFLEQKGRGKYDVRMCEVRR